MTAPSFTRNQHKDMVGERGLKNSVSYFMGSAEADEYNQPLRAEAEWWMGLKDVVREISTTAGADELMVDDIEAISKKIEVSLLKIFHGTTSDMAVGCSPKSLDGDHLW